MGGNKTVENTNNGARKRVHGIKSQPREIWRQERAVSSCRRGTEKRKTIREETTDNFKLGISGQSCCGGALQLVGREVASFKEQQKVHRRQAGELRGQRHGVSRHILDAREIMDIFLNSKMKVSCCC